MRPLALYAAASRTQQRFSAAPPVRGLTPRAVTTANQTGKTTSFAKSRLLPQSPICDAVSLPHAIHGPRTHCHI